MAVVHCSLQKGHVAAGPCLYQTSLGVQLGTRPGLWQAGGLLLALSAPRHPHPAVVALAL